MNEALQRFNFKPDDQVVVKGWPPSVVLEVVDASDQAMLTLCTPSGALLKVGRLAAVKA